MSDDFLKPCPFCQGKAALIIRGAYTVVKCQTCGCRTKRFHELNPVQEMVSAANTWNRRPNEPLYIKQT